MTDKPMNADLFVETDILFKNSPIDGLNIKDIEVPANMTKTVYVPLDTWQQAADVNINIKAVAGKYESKITRKRTRRQVNFPYQYSYSGRQLNDEITFDLPDYIPGTLKAEATAYIQLMEELFGGTEGIIREPHGCFEQLLSSSFPNVFALQLMKATGNTNNTSQEKAMKYIENGYKKLANYEVKKTGGFEWYGGSPAHEMLTAYGLVHFYEMGKVYNKVDRKMVEKALDFLLSRRDGKGGFEQNRGRYGFSAAPTNVNNAYIVYAFNEIEKGDMVEAEYQATLKEALQSKDFYRMALMANAAYQRKDIVSYKKLISHFKDISEKEDFSKPKIEATIVYSYADAANREAVAYWLLAILKDNSYDYDLIQKCLEYIGKGKRGGYFGNTQTTSVCLQALTHYALVVGSGSVKGNFCLNVNSGNETCVNLSDKFVRKEKVSVLFKDELKKGKNTITMAYTETQNPFTYGIDISWYSPIPASSKLCPVKLTAEIKSSEIKVNETVRLSVKLTNTENVGKPMSVAIIGIPGGMSLQPWQLKEMQEKEVFDFYEIIDDNLVIYYRELGPRDVRTIDLDLKAEIPGIYTGMASSAYRYYMNEHKHWINGIKVQIKE